MYVFHTYTAVYIENYLLFFKILFAYKKYECEFENSCELFSSNHSCEFESKTIALKNYFQIDIVPRVKIIEQSFSTIFT